MKRVGFSRLGAAVLVLALIGTACGSSSKKGSSASSSSGTGGSTAKQPTGTPIKVATVYGELTKTDNDAGVQAAVKAINANGGIKGHPLQVTTCSDNNDANTAATCARNAISDSGVIAIVDHSDSYGTATIPLFEQAHMALVGTQMFGTAETKSPNVFGLSSGIFNTIGSSKAAVQLLNAKRIGVPYVDVPAGAQLGPFISKIVQPLGAQAVGVIPVAPTAADVSAQVAQEIDAKPDVIIDGLTLDQYTKFIRTTRQQGSDVTFMVSGGVFDANQVKTQLAGVDKNIVIVGEFDHQSKGYKDFLADMDKFNKSYGNRNDSALSGWAAVKQMEFAANKAATLDRQGILDAMSSTNNFDLGGLTPVLDYTKAQTGLGGTVPRLVDDAIYLYKYNDGKEELINGSPANHLFS